MRATQKIVLGVLTLASAACFVVAAREAQTLNERTNAMARAYTWQAPLPPARQPEHVVDLSPASLEEEEAAAAELELAVTGQDEAIRALALQRSLSPVAPRPPRPAAEPKPFVPTKIVVNEIDPEDAIRMGLRSKRASFEHCYEQELKKQAAFSGFIVVAVSLSANGRVTEARVQEGSRRDAVVGACIVAALRTMKLPPLTSAADLLIPIRLQAREPT